MREMKDSGVDWIGNVPEHWELRRAKSMFKQSTSKGNNRLVLLSATQDRGVVDKSSLDGVVQVSEHADLSTFKTVHKNDFVISLRSFQGGFEISHEEGVISPAYTVFRLSTQTYPHYYRHLFKSLGFIDKINSLTVGIREGKNIQYVDFADMLLPYMPLAEQQKIVEFLDRKCAEIDEMIALQEQIIEELKAYKQSVITEIVTKGLNPNAPMRDSGIDWIGSIPEHWSKDKIIRSFRMIGSGTTPKSTDENNFDGDINWIQSGDINGGVMASCKNRVSNETIENCSALKVYSAPFIIVAMYGASVGNTSISSIDGCVNQACCVLSDSALNFNYAFSVIKSCKDYWLRKAVGGGQPNISQETIKQTWIPIPPITEQQAIADYLDEKCADIDSLIQTKQSKIDSLKEYKKSIIYEYVTGKKEVE